MNSMRYVFRVVRFKERETLLNNLFRIFFGLLVASCAQSPSPTIEDLVEIAPPSFSGLVSKNFTSPTRAFSITGTCDPKSRGIEYKLDSSDWISLSTGCDNNNQFTITGQADGYVRITVRAKKKYGVTAEASASVRWLQPETTPAIGAVAAGQSRHKFGEVSLPGSLTLNYSGETTTAGGKRINSDMVGTVYGQ